VLVRGGERLRESPVGYLQIGVQSVDLGESIQIMIDLRKSVFAVDKAYTPSAWQFPLRASQSCLIFKKSVG
jgi:hypothetical protein